MAKAMRHARKVGLLLFPRTPLATFNNHRWVLLTKKVPLPNECFVIHGTKLLHPYINISREQSSSRLFPPSSGCWPDHKADSKWNAQAAVDLAPGKMRLK